MFFAFFDSTESGFGSDIFDVGATDFTRHSSTIERVRMNDLSFNRFNGRVSLGIF
jgi:hypothetical protein